MTHSHSLDAFEFVEGIGRASACAVSANHTPAPLRYVWHHLLPQVCGGKTVVANLVSLCDNCHLATHAILYELKINNGVLKPNRRFGKRRIELAQQGYAAAVAAGTVALIPNEGQAPE